MRSLTRAKTGNVAFICLYLIGSTLGAGGVVFGAQQTGTTPTPGASPMTTASPAGSPPPATAVTASGPVGAAGSVKPALTLSGAKPQFNEAKDSPELDFGDHD